MDENEAKALAAGPLGENMAKFPLLFAKTVFFGPRPSPERAADINSGTVTLADFGEGPLAITCQHVISCYRERRKVEDDMIFQIGHVSLDPLEQLTGKDEHLDIATIRLTDVQVQEITSTHKIGSCVFRPKVWPSPDPEEGEFIAFGGFPGKLRTVE